MKTLIASYLFVFFMFISSKAQQLLTENKEWTIVGTDWQSKNITHLLRVQGDTIFNGNIYKKLFRRFNQFHEDWTPLGVYLREDSTKKVFSGHSLGESLIFDFGLNKEDLVTIYPHWGSSFKREYIVYAIDTILLKNGEPRKRITLINMDLEPLLMQYWIEGIGSQYGLHDHVFVGFADWGELLLCSSENGELLYQNADYPSCEITSVNEFSSSSITLSPNPFSEKIQVKANLPVEKLALFNINGRKMAEATSQILDTKAVPAGIYFLQIEIKNTNILTRKAVKL